MPRLAVLATLCCLAGFGQESSNSSSGPSGFRGAVHLGPPRFTSPVTGAPYSGEVVTQVIQTLADGTHITETMTPTKVYRDSLGRTREERSPFQGPANKAPNSTDRPLIIEITDPVGQARYILDVRERVAHRQLFLTDAAQVVGGASAAARRRLQPVESAPPATDAKAAHSVTEKLEPQVFEGVLGEGTRTTTTYPEGSMNNDRPIEEVFESWRSPELQIPLLLKSSSPRWGERTQKLTNILRSESEQSLFQPPPDYTLVDEKGDFTIKWGQVSQ